jgi:hypothetical protein
MAFNGKLRQKAVGEIAYRKPSAKSPTETVGEIADGWDYFSVIGFAFCFFSFAFP